MFSIGVFLWKDIFREHEMPFQANKNDELVIVLQKELDLSKAQVEQIKKLRADFFSKERALSMNIRSKRDSMNSEMFNKTTDEILVKSLAKRISEGEYQMELLRFEQSQILKTICTPAQLEKFEGLVLEIRDYLKLNNRPPRR
jgi:Spy/CpxP family protein refolding chaperone